MVKAMICHFTEQVLRWGGFVLFVLTSPLFSVLFRVRLLMMSKDQRLAYIDELATKHRRES